MYYVYVLRSVVDSRYYIGFSADLRKRVANHNAGLNQATKAGLPWELLYYEAFQNELAARRREQKLKQFGKRWAELKKRIDPNNA